MGRLEGAGNWAVLRFKYINLQYRKSLCISDWVRDNPDLLSFFRSQESQSCHKILKNTHRQFDPYLNQNNLV